MSPPLILKHNAFKNAVVKQKARSDTTWPHLNDPQSKTKGPCEKHSYLDINVHSKKSDFLLMSNGSEGNQTFNSGIEDFPELCSTGSKEKLHFSQNKQSSPISSCSIDSKSNCNVTLIKSSYRHSKLKNSTVSVPLLSFLKVRRKKSRLPVKSAQHKSFPSGNKLDSDNPLRRKGKVRLFKKKQESRLKKEIRQSKSIKERHVYEKPVLEAKCLIPSLISSDSSLIIDKLEPLLSSLRIDEKTCCTEESMVLNESSEEHFNEQTESIEAYVLAKSILHSNSFKEYCTNIVNESLLKSAEGLVTTLRNFQDRLHAKDPSKAFAKRRYVCGFKETKKFLLADRIKLIIVATNLQLDTDLPSGRVLEEIKTICEGKKIPLVFAGRGNQIGHWTLKRRRISIISILNYEGSEEFFRKLIKNWEECKMLYESTLNHIELLLSKNPNEIEEHEKSIEEEIREKMLSKLLAGVNSKEEIDNV